MRHAAARTDSCGGGGAGYRGGTGSDCDSMSGGPGGGRRALGGSRGTISLAEIRNQLGRLRLAWFHAGRACRLPGGRGGSRRSAGGLGNRLLGTGGGSVLGSLGSGIAILRGN